MRISTKCSSAIHVLLMIALLPPEKKTTSELLASSVGCNPVEIRKLLSSLKKSGIIDVSRGTGGAILLKDLADISLYDVFSAVDSTSLNELIGIHQNPAEQCPFGKNIYDVLSEPYTEIGNVIKEKMMSMNLQSFANRLVDMESEFFGI